MLFGIVAGGVLVSDGETWDDVAKSMEWWVNEVLISWEHKDGADADARWNETARQTREGWRDMLASFRVRTALVELGACHPSWISRTPPSADGVVVVTVGKIDDQFFNGLPHPGRLALMRDQSGSIRKIKVVSHHVGTMTSVVRLTAHSKMPRGSALRVFSVPWTRLMSR